MSYLFPNHTFSNEDVTFTDRRTHIVKKVTLNNKTAPTNNVTPVQSVIM